MIDVIDVTEEEARREEEQVYAQCNRGVCHVAGAALRSRTRYQVEEYKQQQAVTASRCAHMLYCCVPGLSIVINRVRTGVKIYQGTRGKILLIIIEIGNRRDTRGTMIPEVCNQAARHA